MHRAEQSRWPIFTSENTSNVPGQECDALDLFLKNVTLFFFNAFNYKEPPRPEFAAMAPAMEENPVTGVKEPYFPEKARISRMLTGSMVIVIMVRVWTGRKQCSSSAV